MSDAVPRSSLDVIQNYVGEQLTDDVVERLGTAPASHLNRLFEELGDFYKYWLRNESDSRAAEDSDVFLCIPEWTPGWSWERSIDHFKNVTLFFPRATVIDPISTMNLVPVTFATMGGDELPDDFIEERRTDLQRSLTYLLELAPLIASGDLLLFPGSFALDSANARVAVDEEMKLLTPEDIASYGPDIDEHDIKRVKEFGRVCAACEYSPVAGTKWTRRIIEREYENASLARIPGINHVVNAAMLRYQLPGVSNVSTADLVRLRRDEAAFNLWRNNFGRVLDKAAMAASDNDQQFEVELRQAAAELLEPAIERVEHDRKRSSFLTTVLTPQSMTLLGGFAVWSTTHSFPLTVEFGVTGAGLGWVAESARRGFSKPNRSAKVLRKFFGALVAGED